jgi:hypothetical protein
MRRERKRRREERVCALYLTSKGSPANNELYFSFILFVVKQKKTKQKKSFILGEGGEEK